MFCDDTLRKTVRTLVLIFIIRSNFHEIRCVRMQVLYRYQSVATLCDLTVFIQHPFRTFSVCFVTYQVLCSVGRCRVRDMQLYLPGLNLRDTYDKPWSWKQNQKYSSTSVRLCTMRFYGRDKPPFMNTLHSYGTVILWDIRVLQQRRFCKSAVSKHFVFLNSGFATVFGQWFLEE